MIKRFVLYGLVGWCAEVFWTGFESLIRGDLLLSSHTYGWMFPIYGMAVFLEYVHHRISDMFIIVRGGIYALLILATEFVTGSLLKALLGKCPWDYSDCALNVYGVIRLDYFIVWFITGLLFERIHIMFDEMQNANSY